jgi:hypothetical protein
LIKYILNNNDLTYTKLLKGICQEQNMEENTRILTKKSNLSGGEQHARIQ